MLLPVVSTSNLLTEILARYSGGAFRAEDIRSDMPVFGAGGVITDSLEILDALCAIERAFGINIPDEDLTEELFASVASLNNYVQRCA